MRLLLRVRAGGLLKAFSSMNLTKLRAEWSPNITRDILAGTVVALALIPETIAFSLIAGVDPKVGHPRSR